MITAWPGQARVADLRRAADRGHRPRKDYIGLAEALDADVIDSNFIVERGTWVARVAAHLAGLAAAQVVETFLRRNRYRHIVAWGDQLGMALALLFKATRTRRDLVVVSIRLSTRKKAFLLKVLRIHSHIRKVITSSAAQVEIARTLSVPRHKMELVLQPVDELYWQPAPVPEETLVCAVGAEARDYETLFRAMRGLPLTAEIAVGSMVFTPTALSAGRVPQTMRPIDEGGPPENVTVRHHLEPHEVRSLYARSAFAVVPLRPIDFDAGAQSALEAMAMGKPVILSRTCGQSGLFLTHGREGLYVTPEDATALRTSIESLADDSPTRERMGTAARELVLRGHTLDGYVARLAAIVRDA